MAYKNILLFRGENTRELHNTLAVWKQKFVEKHGDMNLLEIRNDTMFDSVLADCQAGGFMGASRMIIFHEHLRKTKKEQEKIEASRAGETMNLEDIEQPSSHSINDDETWIKTFPKIPETNFLIFIGNTKSITPLEIWLEQSATIKEFAGVSPRDMIYFVRQELNIPEEQARFICERLGFYEEYKWGKSIVIGNPDFIYLEIEKLKLTEKNNWSREELETILPDYRDENAFNMLDPLWDRNPKILIRTWKRLMETADHELTMAMIITMIRKVLIAAAFPGIGDVPITPGQRKTAQKFKNEVGSLRKLYDSIIEVDIAEKSGELPHKTNAFLMALLSFCQ